MHEYFTKRDSFDSDLACERRKADIEEDGVEYKKSFCTVGSWEKIRITNEGGAKSIGRPIGSYDTLTLERMDLLCPEDISDAAEEIASELCYMLENLGISPKRLLVVGLGNRELTPDSVGPRCAEQVHATMHIKEFDEGMFSAFECSEIAVLKPGVMSESGLETSAVIKRMCELIKPDAMIAIDALASKSGQRLGRTVQISDTGIFPGSGIGNHRGAITKETVGTPVIAIGVPTVIDARLLASEEAALGGEAMFVSPKEINGIAASAARIIADGINQAFGISL